MSFPDKVTMLHACGYLCDTEGENIIAWRDSRPEPTMDQLQEEYAMLAPEIPNITPRQMRLWLLSKGLLTNVRAFINQQGEAAMIEWEFATVIHRINPLTEAVRMLLGMTDEQLNQAFIEAATL